MPYNKSESESKSRSKSKANSSSSSSSRSDDELDYLDWEDDVGVMAQQAHKQSSLDSGMDQTIQLQLQNVQEQQSGTATTTSTTATTTSTTYQTRIHIPTHHEMNFEELKTYIYPTNLEVRDYQFSIVRSAFYHNLLVALPTGLGKTFIASTVMLNFLRWFPKSKIVFMAPTKPLVAQQIKACCSITGIPASKVAILLDKTRKNRGEIWNSRQVFFTTPQVVENDLAFGLVNPKSISLLVIDEAHRARGNYSYNNVVNFLKRFNDSFRILALTATPAADVEGVQNVIDNLMISKVEVRTEDSDDIVKYMKTKKVCRRVLAVLDEIRECIDLLATAVAPVLKSANEKGLLDVTDPTRINAFKCMEASRRLLANKNVPEGLKWAQYFILQLLGTVGQCYRRLNIYGVNSFYSYFQEKHKEFTAKWNSKKSKNKLNADFYFSEPIKKLLEAREKVISNQAYSHPKIEALMEELEDFFQAKDTSSSRVIIFTEFRESALEIVKAIENANNGSKPHIFIGQAKEKDKFDEENFGKKKKNLKGKQGKGKNKEEEDRVAARSSSEKAQISGMNQKLQKEIIRQFKNGDYNVLVATSIGEEGLDIGEVDLIVCYDSTSSPIKNIQRMGRTGRKRDGKVVLLFSSNEEMKFDKAMAGYQYIQNHIMQGDLITLYHQNRILPQEFTPEVVRTKIEIPEENMIIKCEDDEDEIIRIATQYMLGNTPKSPARKAAKSTSGIKGTKGTKGSTSKKGSSKLKAEKPQKRFFMPDNVETGFQTVGEMLNEGTRSSEVNQHSESVLLEPQIHPRKTKTVLDKLIDSGSDDDDDDDDDEQGILSSPFHPADKNSLPKSFDNQNKIEHTSQQNRNSNTNNSGNNTNNTNNNTNNNDNSTTNNNNSINEQEGEENATGNFTRTPSTSFMDTHELEPASKKSSGPVVAQPIIGDILDESFSFSDDDDDDEIPEIDPKEPSAVPHIKFDYQKGHSKTLGIPHNPILLEKNIPKKRMLIDENEQFNPALSADAKSQNNYVHPQVKKKKKMSLGVKRITIPSDSSHLKQLCNVPLKEKSQVQEMLVRKEAKEDSFRSTDMEDPFDDDLDEVIANYTSARRLQ